MNAIGETFQDRLALRTKLTGKDLTPTETIQAYAEELCRVANDRDRLQRRLDAMIDQPAPADEQIDKWLATETEWPRYSADTYHWIKKVYRAGAALQGEKE